MTKITLDDIEYNSEDFNEDQSKIYQELINNNNISVGLQYQLNSLNIVRDLLVQRLKKSLTDETVDDDE